MSSTYRALAIFRREDLDSLLRDIVFVDLQCSLGDFESLAGHIVKRYGLEGYSSVKTDC